MNTPALDRFIEAETDDARLALGLDAVEAAYDEACDVNLSEAWGPTILEYVIALRTGEGLNRPL